MIKSIKDIRSAHFTTKIPKRAKLQMKQKALISGTGEKGIVVGMQQHTGTRATTEYSRARGMNRYYVKVKRGIVVVDSMAVQPVLTWSAALKHNLKQAEKDIKRLRELNQRLREENHNLRISAPMKSVNPRIVPRRISDTETIFQVLVD
jgi:hypothetical protein